MLQVSPAAGIKLRLWRRKERQQAEAVPSTSSGFASREEYLTANTGSKTGDIEKQSQRGQI